MLLYLRNRLHLLHTRLSEKNQKKLPGPLAKFFQRVISLVRQRGPRPAGNSRQEVADPSEPHLARGKLRKPGSTPRGGFVKAELGREDKWCVSVRKTGTARAGPEAGFATCTAQASLSTGG